MNETYNPQEYIKQLQNLLISDKKKIGFLFGASTSLALKIQLLVENNNHY